MHIGVLFSEDLMEIGDRAKSTPRARQAKAVFFS
jgi:hypothetical protein